MGRKVLLVLTVFLCNALVTCRDAAPERGVLYRGERIAVVDMHLHTGDWEAIPEDTQESLATRFPFPFNLNAEQTAQSALDAKNVVGELDRAGISTGVLLAIYAPRSVGVATNESVERNVAAAPTRYLALASLRVDDWQTQKEAELDRLDTALAKPEFIGVKLAHAHQHFRFDDPAYYGIYAVAAKHEAPVYLHTGPSPFEGTASAPEYTNPAYLKGAIEAHPDTIFILGHLGYDFINKQPGYLEECLKLAKAHENVYLEPSALGSSGSDPQDENLALAMRRIKEEGLIERVIYGSDGPQSPGFLEEYLERTLTAMEQADYSVEEVRQVLHENFERAFDVSIPAEVRP